MAARIRSGEPPTSSDVLLAAVRRILRPLVRLLIRHSLPFPLVSEVLREVYVDVAAREFPVEGKRQTDSRIHLLTGVHRKDVRRLREKNAPRFVSSRTASLSSTLIARWTTLDELRDEKGEPRPLPRLSAEGGELTFERFVRSVSTDIRPRVVLDEWLRLGIAELDADDRVHLKTDAFVPAENVEEMAHFFGRNVHDHIAAAVNNIDGEGPARLERSVYYNHLRPESVAELEALAREKGMEALREVNARAMKLQRRDSGRPEATHRINFGVYVFTEDESSAPSTEEE